MHLYSEPSEKIPVKSWKMRYRESQVKVVALPNILESTNEEGVKMLLRCDLSATRLVNRH